MLAQWWSTTSSKPTQTDCNKARRLLQVKYRGTFCVSACAAHTLDRLLEDIGKFKRFANTIATMRVIGKVIMAHAASRHECKDKNGGSFGTCCIMCESAKENKSALRKTVVSEAFDEFMNCKKKPKTDQPSTFPWTSSKAHLRALQHEGQARAG